MQDYERVRLFKSNLLEKLSVVHPCVPAIVFTPSVLYFFFHIKAGIMPLISIFLGILSWTFVEYVLHRFIFHLPINTAWAKKISYTVHGIHHRDPKDPLRLVAPPIMSITVGLCFLYIFFKCLPSDIFFGFMFGFTVGYLCYDYLHWIVHHSKSKNRVISYLRRHHAIHHHKGSHQRFGVSSPLWDFIFSTYR